MKPAEPAASTPPLPMLERRRIEAAMLKHVYDTLKASHGETVARQTVADAVRRSSVEQAAEF
ncbi:MAG: 2-amino-thiazoline-4-carboxylic acid hydrolase, partial [Alphaproteobacteria bacterium]|nr:2-amino-thiazoline-4-carboxylic acid hydrolase [Alphaproteobacteria bacterium]